MAHMVNNLPAMQETQVQSVDRGDPLEKGKATYSSILAWRIPWTVEPGGLQSKGHKELDATEVTNTFTFLVAQMVQSLSAMQETWV